MSAIWPCSHSRFPSPTSQSSPYHHHVPMLVHTPLLLIADLRPTTSISRPPDAPDASKGGLAAVMVAAAIGNLVASFLRPPYEVIKQRLQAGIDPNAFAAIGTIYSELGMRGFWQGLHAQMLRDIPYAMFTLGTYEMLQSAFRTYRGRCGGRYHPSIYRQRGRTNP